MLQCFGGISPLFHTVCILLRYFFYFLLYIFVCLLFFHFFYRFFLYRLDCNIQYLLLFVTFAFSFPYCYIFCYRHRYDYIFCYRYRYLCRYDYDTEGKTGGGIGGLFTCGGDGAEEDAVRVEEDVADLEENKEEERLAGETLSVNLHWYSVDKLKP